jgi:hypothetical protein
VTSEAPFTWKLSHANTTASISETVSVLPARIAVWAIDHIISPEITCHFELDPAEITSWTRRWVFDD